MPPKRRKAAEPADAPDPKKRATRSSTKAKASIQAKAVSKAQPPTPKSTEPTRTKAKPRAKGSKQSETAQGPSKDADAHTTFTIEHDAVKNPITCHRYEPSSTSNTNAPTLIFTHGAGGTLAAPAVVNFCIGYSSTSPVLAFQGSMNLGARLKGFHACIAHLSSEEDKTDRVVLGGRSMGARAAVMAATDRLASSDSPNPEISLVLASYPLKGPKDDIRDRILFDLPSSVEVLFVIGDRDSMCPLDHLAKMRKKMTAQSKLIVVKGADHGMHVKPAAEEKRLGEETGGLAAAWVNGVMEEEELLIGGED